MTAIQRVDSTRRILGAAAVAGAVAWGVALTLVILALISLASALSPDVLIPGDWSFVVASIAGAIVIGALLWRDRHLSSRTRVALWIEERIPVLHYSLVTAMEPAFTGAVTSNFAAGLEATVARADIARVTRHAVRKATVPAFAAVALAAALMYVSPASAFGSAGLLARLGDRVPRSTAAPGSKLEDLEVVVTPPAYTGARIARLDDPASVAALIGSRILVTGPGSAEGVRASLGVSRLAVSDRRGGWSVSLTMPRRPVALTLAERGHERLIVLDPRADAAPRIVLDIPARDSTLRVPRGVVRLSATGTDDVGLNEAYFEYLVTTGSGEIFSARTITTPAVRFGGSRTGSLSATLDLTALKLGQGDVVSMRAIVSDRNTLSGPGVATSDTRTFRIARADEYDSVSVDAAAPAAMDSSAISQRMLIIMTEELVAKEKTLSRAELVKQSTSIGDMEDRIRKRVDAILNATDSPDEQAHLEEAGHVHTADENAGPLNRDLVEAYNALWEAVRSLQIAEPAPALPPMRIALKALDRARLANRLYLRGVPPRVIVDLARVRLVGKEKGLPSLRTARTAADTVTAEMAERFSTAIEMLPESSANALRALTLLRVDAISAAPSFAAALGDALAALRSGRDVTLPLLRARRALQGDPTGTSGVPAWSGAW